MGGPGVKSRVSHEIEPLAEEWDELADAVRAAPFLRPGWFSAFWGAFGRGELHLLECRAAGRLTGVLPLARRRGRLDALANYHSPFFAPLAKDRESAGELARAAMELRPRHLSLPLLATDETSASALASGLAAAGARLLTRVQQRTPVVELAGSPDWQTFRAGLSRGLRKELGRYERRIEELGPLELEVVTEPADLDARLEEAFRLEGSGWKAERGTAILSRAETRRFYTDLCRWAVRRGILRLYFLRAGPRALAVDVTLEDGGVRYMLKGGFDPDFGRFAPGTVLLGRGLEEAFARGLHRVELGGGDDPYKLRWTSKVRERLLVKAFAPTALGMAERAIVHHGRPLARRLIGLAQARPRRRGTPPSGRMRQS